jgi:hypothetical protein
MQELPPLSAEQRAVVDTLLARRNVVVDAVPGAGKSTLTLNLVASALRADAQSACVVLSYNRSLADATLARARSALSASVQNLDERLVVHTYHSALAALTQTAVTCDLEFAAALETLERSACPPTKWARAQLLVVDEAQDLRPDFARFVRSLVTKVLVAEPTLLFVGDARQLLYHFYPFSGADARFLTCAPRLFPSPHGWVQLPLTHTFRCARPICRFVEAVARVAQRPVVLRSAFPFESALHPPVQVYACNLYKDARALARRAFAHFAAYGARSTLVLCDSMNERSPCVPLANDLLGAGYDVRVVRSGEISDIALHPDAVEESAVTFRTQHSAKGLESDAVLLLHRRPLHELDNALYVALTRARRALVVLQHAAEWDATAAAALARELDAEDAELYRCAERPLRVGPAAPRSGEGRVTSASAAFRFLDVVLQRTLLAELHVTEVAAAAFPTADLYRAPQDYERSLSDSYHYIQQTHVAPAPGAAPLNLLGVTGAALRVGLYAALNGKQLPARFVPTAPLCRARAERCAARFAQRARPDEAALEHVKRNFGDLVELCVLREASSDFREKLRLADFSFATHFTVFKRLDRAVDLLRSLWSAGFARGAFVQRAAWQGERERFVATPFFAAEGSGPVLHVAHVAKPSADLYLQAALEAALHGRREALVVNLFDGSATRVQLPHAEPLHFARALEAARALEKPACDDDHFVDSFA